MVRRIGRLIRLLRRTPLSEVWFTFHHGRHQVQPLDRDVRENIRSVFQGGHPRRGPPAIGAEPAFPQDQGICYYVKVRALNVQQDHVENHNQVSDRCIGDSHDI